MHSIEVGDVKAVVYGEATVGSPQAFELDSTREDCAGMYVEDQLDNLTEVLEKVREFYAESKTS